jgi:hypothetical protein
MNIFSNIHSKVKKNIVPISIVIILIPIIFIVVLPNKKYYPYNFEENVSTIPFITDDNGYIYIQASFNDTSGIFFLDTGSDFSGIKESLVDKNDTTFSKKVWDAQNISDRKMMVRIRNFGMGEIDFPNFKVWPIDTESWHENGFLLNKDSVIGVIGSDIFSNFIWEFNMEKRFVSIYKPDKYPSSIPDSISIPLLKKGQGYFTEINIDSTKHSVKFDSGCSSPLILRDTFAFSENKFKSYNTTKGNNQTTFFSHLKNDKLQNDTSFCCIIPKVILGNNTMESVICNERAKANLLGISFFWSYEKVVADYPNEKVYFLNKKKVTNKYDTGSYTHNFVRNSYLYQHGTFRIESGSFEKYDILLVKNYKSINQTDVSDTIPATYKIYGESRWWGKSINNLDSILCMDSVQLPNEKVIYDDYKIYAKDKYFYDN